MNPSITLAQMAMLAENIAPAIIEETTETRTQGESITLYKIMYVGYPAGENTDTSNPRWLVKRIIETKTDGIKTTTIDFANGKRLFNQKWDDRKKLEYMALDCVKSFTDYEPQEDVEEPSEEEENPDETANN